MSITKDSTYRNVAVGGSGSVTLTAASDLQQRNSTVAPIEDGGVMPYVTQIFL